MNKEIEETVKDLCHAFGGRDDYETCGDCFGSKNKYYGCQSFAEKLYNAGYRKINQTHKQPQEENVQMSVAKDLSTLLLAEAEYFCDSEGHIDSEKFAEVLIENGYRKMNEGKIRQEAFTAGYEQGLFDARYKNIWHKVADKSLPQDGQTVLIALKNVNGETTTDIDQFICGDFIYARMVDVIAWTELPLYEGEE